MKARAYRAAAAIAPGDELVYDYLSTETAQAEPFDCRCGARGCRRRIVGRSALLDGS